MSDDQATQIEESGPFTGDRGWKGLERSEGEGAMFALVVVLLLVAVGALVLAGVTGLGLVYVVLSLVTLALLVYISIGQ